MQIKTRTDWWIVLSNEWSNLQLIFAKFLTSKGEEQAREAFVNRDETLMLSVLNNAWWNAPDNPSIHEIPGWNTLCDLCSESWVFDE
jgi:hypothetical protein